MKKTTMCAAIVIACAALADDAAKMKSGMMNPGNVLRTAERIGGGAFKVLIYGNSIALHGPKPDIGWTNDWGMAASAPEKDFAHLVATGLEAKLGKKADFRIRNLAVLERNFTTNVETVAEICADAKWKPDYVVIAVGENVPNIDSATSAAYGRFLADIARPFADSGAQIVMRSPFWKNALKAECTAKAAAEVGAVYVDVGSLGSSAENKAIGLFSHAGVANHPGDLGMRRIADLILAGFAVPRVARTIRPAGTGFFFNPELNTFLPLNDDYDVTLDGRKAEVRAGVRYVSVVGKAWYDSHVESCLKAEGIRVSSIEVDAAFGPRRVENLERETCRALDRLFDERGRKWLPDLIYVEDDYQAIGALFSLLSHGVKIPKDLLFVTARNFGNGPEMPMSLTCIEFAPAVAGAEVGRAAVGFLKGGDFSYDGTSAFRYVIGESFPENNPGMMRNSRRNTI